MGEYAPAHPQHLFGGLERVVSPADKIPAWQHAPAPFGTLRRALPRFLLKCRISATPNAICFQELLHGGAHSTRNPETNPAEFLLGFGMAMAEIAASRIKSSPREEVAP